MAGSTNKRKNERFSCLVPVIGKEGSTFDHTKTVDFSKGGIGFISQNEVPIDKEIAIELDLDEKEEPVFVIGKVKWVHPVLNSHMFRIGVYFENILKGSRTHLSKYFKERLV